MKGIWSFIFIVFLQNSMISQGVPVNYIKTAEEFLSDIQNKQNVDNYLKIFEICKIEQIRNQIATDEQKFAFWLNIYNAYIQVILTKHPEKYDDRGTFFKDKQINIGGILFSFADIEHGILRRSQHEYFLGYLTKLFPSSIEKMLRVQKRDWRIHFALNCGAKSCPPVAVYDVDRLDEQLNASALKYLKTFTTYNKTDNTASVTSLFSWFRGDFGGLEGIKTILKDRGLIPDKSARLKTSYYDWTLDLGNFISL